MSNLSNLYISQSFFGVVNLENSLEPLPSASGDVNLQDGVGNNLGLLINSSSDTIILDRNVDITKNLLVSGTADFKGDVEVSGSVDISGSLRLHGDWELTGSLDVLGDITGSNLLINNTATIQRAVIQGDLTASNNVLIENELQANKKAYFNEGIEISGSTDSGGNFPPVLIISGSSSQKFQHAQESFKITAPGGQEIVKISTGNPGSEGVSKFQDSMFLYKSGSSPSFKMQQNDGGGNTKNSTWAIDLISFPSGAYGDIQQVKTATSAGGRQFDFGDCANISNTSGLTNPDDGRAGIYFGEFFGFNADFIIGKDKSNSRTIIGGPGTTYMSASVDIQNNLTVHGTSIVNGNISASGTITADTVSAGTGSFDTINARIIHTTIESSSVILSSGSNVLGDESTDTQILSGSVFIPNLEFLAGNATDTDTRINAKLNTTVFNAYTQSTDLRIDSLESFTGSLVTNFITRPEFDSYTSSVETEQSVQDNRLNNLELETASIDNRLDNIQLETASLQSEIDGISNATGSYARLDVNNNFVQQNNFFSGSVQGGVHTILAGAGTSYTASVDCSRGNFFKLNLGSNDVFHLTATNINEGGTYTLLVDKTASGATMTIDSGSILFPNGARYTVSAGTNVKDVLTFVSYDSSALFSAGAKNFI